MLKNTPSPLFSPEELKRSNELLELFKLTDRQNFLNHLVLLLKKWTNCSAIGVRVLDKKGNIPYESYSGFSKNFYQKECLLSIAKDNCICTRVANNVHEKQDQESISNFGSFFNKDIRKFTFNLNQKQLGKYRGECMRVGFSTLALIPIRHLNSTIALVHLADKRKNKLDQKQIEQIEKSSPLIGEAINRFNMEEEISKNYDIQKTINSILKISQQDIPLNKILKKSLDLLLSINWLSFESTGSIFVKEDNSEYFEMIAEKGISAQLKNQCKRILKGQCLCGLAAKRKKMVFTNKITKQHAFSHGNMRPHGHYCVPIIDKKEVLGILNIYVKEDYIRKRYEEDFLQAIADTLAGIIKLKKSQKALSSANRARIVLSQSNHALIHANSEKDLLDKICKIIVRSGGYRLAWVGKPLNDKDKSVAVMAKLGMDQEYIKRVKFSWSKDKLSGNGPVGRSVRSRKPFIIRNIFTDSSFAPWRKYALKRGFSSIVSLPLITNNKLMGILAIYAREINSFDKKEIKLLKELASDLAFGLYTLKLKKQKNTSENKLRRSKELLESAFSNTHFLMAYLDKSFHYKRVNDAYAQEYNDKPRNFVGKSFFKINKDQELAEILKNVAKSGKPLVGYAKLLQENDGSLSFWDWTIEPITNTKRKITGYLLTLIEVTDRIKSEQKLLESYKHMGSVNRQISIILEMLNKSNDKNDRRDLLDYINKSAKNISGADFVGIYKYNVKYNTFQCVNASQDKMSPLCSLDISKSPINTFDLLTYKKRTQGILSRPDKKGLKVKINYYVFKPIIINSTLWGGLFFGFTDKTFITSQELDFYQVFVSHASLIMAKINM